MCQGVSQRAIYQVSLWLLYMQQDNNFWQYKLVLRQLQRQLALRLRNKSVISHLWLKIAHTPWHILKMVIKSYEYCIQHSVVFKQKKIMRGLIFAYCKTTSNNYYWKKELNTNVRQYILVVRLQHLCLTEEAIAASSFIRMKPKIVWYMYFFIIRAGNHNSFFLYSCVGARWGIRGPHSFPLAPGSRNSVADDTYIWLVFKMLMQRIMYFQFLWYVVIVWRTCFSWTVKPTLHGLVYSIVQQDGLWSTLMYTVYMYGAVTAGSSRSRKEQEEQKVQAPHRQAENAKMQKSNHY